MKEYESDKRPELKERRPDPFQIAIDGTVASGKGATSRLLAEILGVLYLDTGAMYRCVAYLALKQNISPSDEEALVEQLRRSNIVLRTPHDTEIDGRLITVLLNGDDVSWTIRSEEIGTLSAITSQHLKVRKELVAQQQQIASKEPVVMEGRDISHKVLPKAKLKIFMDADPMIRAQRRYRELLSRGVATTFENVLTDLTVRDQRDFETNLRRVPGVWNIDTSNMKVDEVVSLITTKARLLMDKS